MALQPTLAFTAIGSGPHSVELWLDLLCPFSAKCCSNLAAFLVPAVLPGGEYEGCLKLLIRPYPQAWHPQGAYLAEATMAFGKAFCQGNSALWFSYFNELMTRQSEFYDPAVRSLTPDEIKEKLYLIAGEVIAGEGLEGVTNQDAVAIMTETMQMNESKFGGTKLSADLKYFVKLGRQNGIHATLSAVVNGIFEPAIQSSWAEEEWTAYLA